MTRRSILWWRRTTMDRWCIMKGMPSRSMTRFRPSYLCWIAVLFSVNASAWVRAISWESSGTMDVFPCQPVQMSQPRGVGRFHSFVKRHGWCRWSGFSRCSIYSNQLISQILSLHCIRCGETTKWLIFMRELICIVDDFQSNWSLVLSLMRLVFSTQFNLQRENQWYLSK